MRNFFYKNYVEYIRIFKHDLIYIQKSIKLDEMMDIESTAS